MTHPDLVLRLCKPGAEIHKTLTPNNCHLIHMAMGVVGEAGELLDAIKKHAIYNQPLDVRNVIEELGDIEFYLHGLRHALVITREDTLASNIAKLQVRYQAGYSDSAAKARADKA